MVMLKQPTEDKETKIQSKNISEGGICFSVKKQYDVGNILSLMLFLRNKFINITGKVAWIEKKDPNIFEIGVEFININKDDLEEIKKIIAA